MAELTPLKGVGFVAPKKITFTSVET
jgi:hypothetical protein